METFGLSSGDCEGKKCAHGLCILASEVCGRIGCKGGFVRAQDRHPSQCEAQNAMFYDSPMIGPFSWSLDSCL